MHYEKAGKRVFLLEHAQHLALLNSKYGARRHRSSCRHADSLTRKACLTKEVALPQNCEDRFFALFGGDRELYSAFLNVEDSLGGLACREDCVVLLALRNRSCRAHCCKERLGIERNPYFFALLSRLLQRAHRQPRGVSCVVALNPAIVKQLRCGSDAVVNFDYPMPTSGVAVMRTIPE